MKIRPADPSPRECTGRDLVPGMVTYYRVIKHGEVTFKLDEMLLDRLPNLATHDQCIHFRTRKHTSVCYFRNGRVWVKGPFAVDEIEDGDDDE